ncbi:hypothetical protein Trydic_g2533 [Trypoxylus dichotomus]
MEGAPMGSPISPIIANIFMEDFEIRVLDTVKYKPKQWLRYVDGTFIIWTHDEDKLQDFLSHLNNIHSKIKFTMEITISRRFSKQETGWHPRTYSIPKGNSYQPLYECAITPPPLTVTRSAENPRVKISTVT